MFYLIATILSSTTILICFRFFNKLNISTYTAIIINYLVASGLGYLIIGQTQHPTEIFQKPWLPLSVLTGVLLFVGFQLYASSTQKVGLAITAIAARISVVIPVILGIAVFGENAGFDKLIGILLTLFAFLFILKNRGGNKVKMKTMLILPLLLFFAQGMNDTALKVAQFYFISNDYTFFLATAFLFALISGVLISILKKHSFIWSGRSIAAGIILGTLNYVSTYFFLIGLSRFDASVFIPMVSAGIVALAAVSGIFIFKERLSWLNYLGVVFAVIALWLLNN